MFANGGNDSVNQAASSGVKQAARVRLKRFFRAFVSQPILLGQAFSGHDGPTAESFIRQHLAPCCTT